MFTYLRSPLGYVLITVFVVGFFLLILPFHFGFHWWIIITTIIGSALCAWSGLLMYGIYDIEKEDRHFLDIEMKKL